MNTPDIAKRPLLGAVSNIVMGNRQSPEVRLETHSIWDNITADPQIDFCRCFGGMERTGREIALYPPGYSRYALCLASHKSFWGPSLFDSLLHYVSVAKAARSDNPC